jgi:hypothetical protein
MHYVATAFNVCNSQLHTLPLIKRFGRLIRQELAEGATIVSAKRVQPFLRYFATAGHVV